MTTPRSREALDFEHVSQSLRAKGCVCILKWNGKTAVPAAGTCSKSGEKTCDVVAPEDDSCGRD